MSVQATLCGNHVKGSKGRLQGREDPETRLQVNYGNKRKGKWRRAVDGRQMRWQ